MELEGDGREGIAAVDAVVSDPEPLIGRQLRDVVREHIGRLYRHQHEVRTRGVGGPAVERGIELVELIRCYAGDFGRNPEIDLPLRRYAGEVRLVGNGAERQSKTFRIEHQAPHGEK